MVARNLGVDGLPCEGTIGHVQPPRSQGNRTGQQLAGLGGANATLEAAADLADKMAAATEPDAGGGLRTQFTDAWGTRLLRVERTGM